MWAGRQGHSWDWQNHLYLVAKQASHVETHLIPTFFLNTVDRGWFYPFYAFYGGTLYFLVALLGVLIGSVWTAYIMSYSGAVMAAFGGWTWLARTTGLRGPLSYFPGWVFIAGAYYVTNAYGRGAWPEFVATSFMILGLAAVVRLVSYAPLHPFTPLGLTVAATITTGSHTITLVLAVPVLFAVAAGAFLIQRPSKELARRLAYVTCLVAGGIGANGWFLVPLAAYRDTIAFRPDGGLTYREFDQLSVIFSPWYVNPGPWSTPDLYVQAPVVPLAAAVVVMLYGAFVVRRLRLMVAGLVVTVACGIVLLLITGSGVWSHVPKIFHIVQFPYRLNTYLLAGIAGLVLVACHYAGCPKLRDRVTGQRLVRLLAVSVAMQLAVGLLQTGSAGRADTAGDVLTDLDRLPPTFYDEAYFNATLPVVGARLPFADVGSKAPVGGLVEFVVPPAEETRLVEINVIPSPLIEIEPAHLVGRANGHAVLLVASSEQATRYTVTPALTLPVLAGRALSVASILALGLCLAYFARSSPGPVLPSRPTDQFK